jgi:hypothetical protein
MFGHINVYKLRDKMLLATICIIVFGILYSTLPRNQFTFDNSDLIEILSYSLSLQVSRFDFVDVRQYAYALSIFHVIIAYIIIIM